MQLAAHPLCAMCLEDGRSTPATICDHDDPSDKLNPETFFTGKKTSLCKLHHDSTKQRIERGNGVVACGVDGWPLDPSHFWNRA